MILGCHVRMKAPLYVEGSVKEALGYGANALMIYTGAPQNTRRTDIDHLHIPEAKALLKEAGISLEHLIVHAPYIINPANSVKPEVGELAVQFLRSEAERTKAIGARYLILHPGSYTSTDLQTGIRTIITHLNMVDLPEGITVCLETMAGKGSETGYTFDQIAEILKGLKQKDQYGVCLDTCHIHDAGYEIHDFDAVLDSFEGSIGLERLHVIHLNDSKNVRGSRKDRHANIGLGEIGFETLEAIASNPRIENIPKILETPYIDRKPPYQKEISMLRTGKYEPGWEKHLQAV